MKEMQVRSLGREDPLEKEMSTHARGLENLAWKEIFWKRFALKILPGKKSFLAWKILWTEATVHRIAKIWTQLNG